MFGIGGYEEEESHILGAETRTVRDGNILPIPYLTKHHRSSLLVFPIPPQMLSSSIVSFQHFQSYRDHRKITTCHGCTENNCSRHILIYFWIYNQSINQC